MKELDKSECGRQDSNLQGYFSTEVVAGGVQGHCVYQIHHARVVDAVAVRMREAVAGVKPAKADGGSTPPFCLPGFALLPAPCHSVIPVPSC